MYNIIEFMIIQIIIIEIIIIRGAELMQTFIGRRAELDTLDAEYKRDNGFVVIYGRRRVGKTRLIKEFIKDKNAFYFLATKEIESQSMKRFAGVIARATKNPTLAKVNFNDWLDLFQVIADYKPEEKKIIVIDEFPYLVKTNEAFPSILQNAWDEILCDNNVMLILCGSLISMMKKHALSYDSPIYGRRTAQIRLMPLTFSQLYKTQNLSFTEAVEQYSVTGGVPKYLEFFDDKKPLYEQITNTVLSKNGFLYEEPQFLLENEVQTPNSYFSIIKAIADKNHKLSKITAALSLETSKLTPYLTTLIELGFIEKRIPITEKSSEKTRRGLYFISDNFIRFWFKYVYPFKGELELDNTQIVLDELNKTFIERFVADEYENICQNLFAHFCEEGIINFVPSKIGSYWLNDVDDDNTQIDVMAVDKKNKILFAGECKYYTSPVDAKIYFNLKKKVEQSGEIQKTFDGYRVIYGVFSKSGFTDRLIDVASHNDSLLLINGDKIL